MTMRAEITLIIASAALPHHCAPAVLMRWLMG
jgi:hypothetical protein